MKPAVFDSKPLKTDDGKTMGIRTVQSGFLPEAMLTHIEEFCAESLHLFLEQCNYRWMEIEKSTTQQILTESLEHECDQLKDLFGEKVRYAYVERRCSLQWALEIHLEEASAPCIIKLEMSLKKDDL